MDEYSSGPRPLSWPLLNPLVGERTVEDDDLVSPSSFVWPTDPDERTLVPFWLSQREWTTLGSAIDVGSDIAYGEDALRVWWLWQRNMRVNVPICDLIIDCINSNPGTINAIVNQLITNTTFNEYLTQVSVSNNIYPPRPTAATPDPLCNAATYVVSQLRALIEKIYDDLETLDASEVLAGLLGLAGWQSSILYQLIGLLETNDKTALLTAFDAAAPDLICQLVDAELDQTPVLALVAATYPSPSVLGDALTRGIESAANEGRWSTWIAVGATMTDADCSGCGVPPDPNCEDVTVAPGNWSVDLGNGTYYPGEGFGGVLYAPDYVLWSKRANTIGTATKIVLRFNGPVGQLFFYRAGNYYLYYGGPPTSEIEFSAATYPSEWTNTDLSSGIAFRAYFGMVPERRFIEACIYLAP